MGIGEGDAFRRQGFQIGCLGLGIAIKRRRPVIQVIDGDEEDVWFFVLCLTVGTRQAQKSHCQN